MIGRSRALGILVVACWLCCQGAVTPPGAGLASGTAPGPLGAGQVPSPPGVPKVVATEANRGQQQQLINNNAVQTDDTYSIYRNLMDLRQSLEDSSLKSESDKESPTVRTIKNALMTVVDAIRHSFNNGFLPAAERHRRDADASKKPYLDGVTYVVGSLLGKQGCSNMIACRTGKFVQTRVPGAQLAVMMMETMVPQSMLTWFGVLKKSVMDRSDQCDNDYDCQLSDSSGPPPVVVAAPPFQPPPAASGNAVPRG